MIKTLSENVIVPIAGLVITYVLCYELISMIIDKNNLHELDTFMFFKWFFKAWVAVFIVTHTFDITMAVFDVDNILLVPKQNCIKKPLQNSSGFSNSFSNISSFYFTTLVIG